MSYTRMCVRVYSETRVFIGPNRDFMYYFCVSGGEKFLGNGPPGQRTVMTRRASRTLYGISRLFVFRFSHQSLLV